MANRQYTMWMCSALSKYAEVFLCVEKLVKSPAEVFRFYNVQPSFEIREIGPVRRPRSFWFAWRLAPWIASEQPTLIYLSDIKLLSHLRRFARRANYVYDTENLPSELGRYLACLGSARAVVCYNQFFQKALMELGVDPGKIIIAPSGVKLEDYRTNVDTKILRRELGLPLENKIVMYTGHFYEWKGADVLLRAALQLKAGTEVFLIGGKEADVQRMTALAAETGSSNVHFIPFQPPGLIPKYQQAADVMILPNVNASEHSSYYTSPLKLFQYMAAGKPIVASDLPSVRTVLNADNAYLVPPNDPQALAQGIRDALSQQQLSTRKAERAREDVKQYTWEKRAEKILNFVSETSPKLEKRVASGAVSYSDG